MSSREITLSALFVFAVAFVVRAVAAQLVVFPLPEDTAYYVGVARNLLAGEGLTSNALWSFQTPPLSFPRPAFEVWLPLPTIIAALPMALLGSTFAAAQWTAVVVGALVPVLAWRLGADVAIERGLSLSRTRVLAMGAGLTACVYLPLVLHSTLPDSTMLFAAIGTGACLLMPRILRIGGRVSLLDWRMLGLGILIGLAALTRNEAVWIGLAWAVFVWLQPRLGWRRKFNLVAVPALIAFAILSFWLLRNWVEFHNPLPSQTLANALSVTGFDIFAWSDPPTLSRYLELGPRALVAMRFDGIRHDLMNVLLIPGFPTSVLGLIALPKFAHLRALRALTALSVTTFLVTSLVFPVSTTWGTYLHAAGPAHVLLIVCAINALDVFIEWVGRRRGWTRPVAWLGSALTIAASLLFLVAPTGMPLFGGQSHGIANRYEGITEAFSAAGRPIDERGPVITNFPIWLAEGSGAQALALPNESPESVVDLAEHFGSSLLLVVGDVHGQWPGVLDDGGPGTECFHEFELPTPNDLNQAEALEEIRVFEVACP